MNSIEIIGLIAATCTTAAYVPQVYKTFKNRSAKDVSMTMYLVLLLGILLWLVYGIGHQSLPIILANSITGFLVLLMIWMKKRFR